MKQLLILSGKGGTGKTTIASAFIRLAKPEAYADCDVDAPNLHLTMHQLDKPKKTDYMGMPRAEIDPDKCIACGKCKENCRFNAISSGDVYLIDPFACEGCGVCEILCPADAISMRADVAGNLMLYDDNNKVFSTAQLRMGNGTSGMLVSEVKKQMKNAAPQDTALAIIDGSPGIGCPVIASLSGVDMVLIVSEPSVSGISDMERIVKTAEHFKTKIAVCVNKYNTNVEQTKNIQNFCKTRNLPFVGKVPFDPEAVKAINKGISIVDVDCCSGKAAKEVFEKTIKLLFDENNVTL